MSSIMRIAIVLLVVRFTVVPARAAPFDPVEATITELQDAYAKHRTTAVSVVKRYLHRIAKQDDAVRGACDGQHIGQRDLAGLVDEQDIDRLDHLRRCRTTPARS